jgi:hypothetical protein
VADALLPIDRDAHPSPSGIPEAGDADVRRAMKHIMIIIMMERCLRSRLGRETSRIPQDH